MTTEDPPGQGPRELLTQKEYAEHRGCSKQYVNQLVRMGRIQLVDGKIDPIAADAALDRTMDPSRIKPAAKGPEPMPGPVPKDRLMPDTEVAGSYYKARAAREQMKALRERAELEIWLGRLCVKEEVEDFARDFGSVFKVALLSSMSGLSARLAATFKVDENEVAEILRNAFNDVLTRAVQEAEEKVSEFMKRSGTDSSAPPAEQ